MVVREEVTRETARTIAAVAVKTNILKAYKKIASRHATGLY